MRFNPARLNGTMPRQISLRAPVPFSLSPGLVASSAVLGLGLIPQIGTLGVLVFFVLSSALIFTRPAFNLRQLGRFSPLLILPVLAIFSTLWSDAPQRSLRLGLELLGTFAAAIVISRNLRLERLLAMLFIVCAFGALVWAPAIPGSVVSGQPLGGNAFKNPIGFNGFMLSTLALSMLVDRAQPVAFRFCALLMLPLGIITAKLSQSGGGATSLALTLILFPPLALIGSVRLPIRVALAVFSVLLVAVATLFMTDITHAVTTFRSGVLNKDATLTGRTHLWEFASRLSAERPLLGHGYSAFWRQGNVDAEGLWRWAGIASRTGFNFHNEFVEMRVDLGWVGVVLLALTCAVIATGAVMRQIAAPRIALATLITIVIAIYARSYVEDGLVAPFSVLTVLWLATFVYAVLPGVGIDEDLGGRRNLRQARQLRFIKRYSPAVGRTRGVDSLADQR